MDGKVVVLDLGDVYAEHGASCGEVGRVWKELVGLGEVDEGADACLQESVELLLCPLVRDVG